MLDILFLGREIELPFIIFETFILDSKNIKVEGIELLTFFIRNTGETFDPKIPWV